MSRQFDELDAGILREIRSPSSFRWDARESYARMASRLGVDEETVRRRVTRLQEDGVIGKFVLGLNPHLLGGDLACIYLELKDSVSREQAISKIKLMDEIVVIHGLHKDGLLLFIYFKDDSALARRISLIESICITKVSMVWKLAFPPFELDMSKTDWKILYALRKDPRKKTSDLASDLGISPRTVKRRVTQLSEGKAFFLDVDINLAKIGGFPYVMIVYCADGVTKKEVDKVIMSGIRRPMWIYTASSNHSIFALGCENISETDRISNWVMKINGVSDLKAGILENRTFVEDWVDTEIQKKVASFQSHQ